MKKLVTLLLALTLAASTAAFVSCGNGGNADDTVSDGESGDTTAQDTASPTETDAPAEAVETNLLTGVSVPAQTLGIFTSERAPGENVSGTLNTEQWTTDENVDYSLFDYFGRGEDIAAALEEKYPDFKISYHKLYKDGGKSSAQNSGALMSQINILAKRTVDAKKKTVTVDYTTLNIRAQLEYTEMKGRAGSFFTVQFVTNLPSVFIVSIGAKGDVKGDICQEGIIPEALKGSDGVYIGTAKLTVPYSKSGGYYLNLSVDSGNAGFPKLLSIPFEIEETTNDSEYKLLFSGDWDLITDASYKQNLVDLFYSVYPRLNARWGFGSEPKTITFRADKNYDGVAYASGTSVCVAVDYANENPNDIGFFSHEITHSVQQYGAFSSSWWTENMANYGGFRYFHWADARYVQVFDPAGSDVRDWGYAPYGRNTWFFAYMDARYPTLTASDGTVTLGLVDSINTAIKKGTIKSDGGATQSDSGFNAIVEQVTGFKNIEELRKYYVKELDEGTWVFTGFGDYADNYITEGLSETSDPVYPKLTEGEHGNATAAMLSTVVSEGDNLASGATVLKCSGYINETERAALLVDGNLKTKWCATTGNVTDKTYLLEGVLHYIALDLGAVKTFNTYTLYNAGSQENAAYNASSWELLVSDDGESWRSVDYQSGNGESVSSYNIGATSARYVMLKVWKPDNGVGTVRLYELMLFNN